MKKKILVTGGTGYIGSHTVVELIQNNYEVIIIDNLSNSKPEALDGIEKITGIRPIFEKVDLCQKNEVETFFTKYKDLNGIIHFAANKAVGESVENPLMYYHNNLISMIYLLEAIKNYGKNIELVFSSSCAVYGDSDILPVSEDIVIKDATSPYGRTKQIAEKMIQDTVLVYNNLQCIALRYFNPIGAHFSGKIGEAPLQSYNLIPILTQTATQKRKEMYVYGNDYDTPDGTCLRDYIHVVDIAKAHIIAMNRLLERQNISNFEFYNLGLGQPFSVLEIIKTFEKVSEKTINYKIVERRTGDVASVYASTKLANEVLKWKAELNLEDMLLSAWKWESEYRYY